MVQDRAMVTMADQ